MISQKTFTKQWLMEINNKLGWNRHETQLKNMEKIFITKVIMCA